MVERICYYLNAYMYIHAFLVVCFLSVPSFLVYDYQAVKQLNSSKEC